MGRSVPSLTASRASQMASRSYVFGKDDSNSGAPPTDRPDGTAPVPSLLACHHCMLLIWLNTTLVRTIRSVGMLCSQQKTLYCMCIAICQAVNVVEQVRHALQWLQVTGPTSFSELESMLGDSSGGAGSSSAKQHESKEASRKPSLLGRLAGSSSKLGPAAGSMSATDLQNALASSFGAHAAAKANNAMKRR